MCMNKHCSYVYYTNFIYFGILTSFGLSSHFISVFSTLSSEGCLFLCHSLTKKMMIYYFRTQISCIINIQPRCFSYSSLRQFIRFRNGYWRVQISIEDVFATCLCPTLSLFPFRHSRKKQDTSDAPVHQRNFLFSDYKSEGKLALNNNFYRIYSFLFLLIW